MTVKQSDASSRSRSGTADLVNGDTSQNLDKNETDSKIENIVLLHDKVTSMPGMVDGENSINDFDDFDIDEVELVAESDDCDYDEFNDQWSVGTPSLPPLSLSSSEESVNYEFDQSSQSDFSTLAYKRSKLPLQSSTGIKYLLILLCSLFAIISHFCCSESFRQMDLRINFLKATSSIIFFPPIATSFW